MMVMREWMRNLREGKTVILSSPILSEVEGTCDRILIIHRGRIVADGTAESLRMQAQGEEMLKVQIETIAGESPETGLRSIASVTSVESMKGKPNYFKVYTDQGHDARKANFDMCVRNQWYWIEMTGQ